MLHDQEEYGVLRWSQKEIAQATGARPFVSQSLIVKGVLKGADIGKPYAAFIFTPRHAGQEGTPVAGANNFLQEICDKTSYPCL